MDTEHADDQSQPRPDEANALRAVAPGISPQVQEEHDCPVCFEAMGGACPVHKLSCGHSFHHSCIQRWLRQNASCPICKATTPAGLQEGQPAFRIDLGHQEMSRILQELEEIFEAIHQVVEATRPISIAGLVQNLCTSLGYEDEDELEEAIGGSLADFLSALPHFEVLWPQEGESAQGWPKACMRPAESDCSEDRAGTKSTFTASDREDLWRIVLQGPQATLEIPELEFAIKPQPQRRVDTIYNIIAASIFHLGDHLQVNSREGVGLGDQVVDEICRTIDNLNTLLDMEQPFTVVISDPQGISELKPNDGVHIEPYIAEEDS